MIRNFQDSWLKWQRAICHIEDFDKQIAGFLETKFYQISIKEYVDAGYFQLEFIMTKTIPSGLSLIVGDAIHNLRASLDSLAYSIVSSNNTYFPIFDYREKFTTCSTSRKIEIISKIPKLRDFLLNEIKPYKGGNFYLWELHRLDIIDKHRLIIPTIIVSNVPDVCIEDSNNNSLGCFDLNISHDNISHAFLTPTYPHIKSHGNPTVQVLFSNSEVFTQEPVGESLRILAKSVAEVINLFKNFFLHEYGLSL